MKLFIVLTAILCLSSACSEVKFEGDLPSSSSQASSSSVDNNFDENGNFIDNQIDGAAIAEITSPLLNPNTIGEQGQSLAGNETCVKAEGVTGCYDNSKSEIFVGDSFERTNIAPANNDTFGWRAVINDNGTIISGTAANNVEFQSYDNSILGETSSGNKSLYFTGRAGGSSIHSLYLITKAFDLSDTNGIVYFSFDYLPIGLETNEYLRLEVCNNSLEKCGVGTNISVAGLNGSNWKPIFESKGKEVRSGLNGFNHLRSDWINKQVAVRLDGFQRHQFVFRINAKMNEGFKANNIREGIEDAVGIDNFKAITFLK